MRYKTIAINNNKKSEKYLDIILFFIKLVVI